MRCHPLARSHQLMASGFKRDLLEDILIEIQAQLFSYQCSCAQ